MTETPNASFLILDTETTGLDPSRHHVWEVAWIRADFFHAASDSETDRLVGLTTRQFFVELPRFHSADEEALAVGQFEDRYDPGRAVNMAEVAATLDFDCAERNGVPVRLACSNPTFDWQFMTAALRYAGARPPWHYRPVDVIDYARAHVSALTGRYDFETGSDWVGGVLGVHADDYARHTALGDTFYIADILSQVLTGSYRTEPWPTPAREPGLAVIR